MSGKWDTRLKQLLHTNPADFIRWFFPEAQFEGIIDTKSNNLETRQLEVDGLFRITLYSISCLVHIEFQSYYDEDMAKRMWEYNALASILYGYPTYSVVIYVKKCTTPEPYYERRFPTGDLIEHFRFRIIKLWELRPEDIEGFGLAGLYPLIVLTENGNDPAMIEHLIARINQTEENSKKELLSFLYLLASLVTKPEVNQQWLKRRFIEMHDILRESWAYQEILQEGLAEGLEKGLAEGLAEGLERGLEKGLEKGLERGLEKGLERGREEGREMERRAELERQRLTLTTFVQQHYPDIAQLARSKVASVGNPETLQLMIMHILVARTQEQVAAILTEEPQGS